MGRLFGLLVVIGLLGLLLWKPALRLIYPTPYAPTVTKLADQYRLDPLLIYAVAFEESKLDPNAKSPKGALGLMQIIPDTGAFIAQSLGYSNFQTDNLFEPELNLTFGSWYLKYLLDRMGGDEARALMAYNGGETAVRAEEPSNESRTFAKRVGETVHIYRRIYNQSLQ